MEEPTDWTSNLVVVRKSNGTDLRICLDPSDLNKVIKRPKFPLPTVEEIMNNLNGAKIFSIADAKSGYWQIELTQNSSYLTTFNTPFGRYRWLRMPFGICSASEEYQMRMMTALEGLNGIAIVADDILIYGKGDTEEEAEQDHDQNLMNLLERCRARNLKLNFEKF